MEESRSLDDVISEHNGSRTIWQQFKDIRVSISNVLKSIHNVVVRLTVAEADIMDLRSEIAAMKENKDAS